jgi:signal transduction histidine kinase
MSRIGAGAIMTASVEAHRPMASQDTPHRQPWGFRGKRVRGPILVTFTLLMAFVIGSFLGAAYLVEARSQRRAAVESSETFRQLFELMLDREADTMHGTLDALTRNTQVRDAFLAGRRDELYRLVLPLFDDLRDERRITHLSFLEPDQKAFLRVHDPANHGDRVDLFTVHRAGVSGSTTSGLELDDLGTVALRVVRPWQDGPKVAGYVVIGEEIGRLIDRIHQVLNLEIAVVVPKSLLDRTRWENGLSMLGRRGDWGAFPSAVVVTSTMATLPSPLAAMLTAGRQPAEPTIELRDDGRFLNVVFLPLQDSATRRIGEVMVVRDITESRDAFHRSMALIGIVSAVAGSGVFAVFFVILTHVERNTLRQHELETQFARLSADHQRIVQIEKLSEVGRTIGEIAHQINNPLVGVINLTQLAEREADDPTRVRALLVQIRKAGEDCHAFVKRMTQFTRIARMERKPTDLVALVDETVALFLHSHRRGTPIDSVLPDRPVVLDVDPTLIRHALFNLLANAVEASPAGTPVTVRLAPPESGDPGWWCLAVLDCGPGVRNDILDQIFVPFFTTRPEGTGLGLPVVQHIVMLHGGKVSVTNRPEGGACFALWLPESGPQETELLL